jgi:phenylalanyl-tRNA synthetase beta chain
MRVPYNWLKDYINTDLTPKEIAQNLTMVGHALDKAIYEQEGDTVIDLEDRGNRGDVMGILGIARDLAAVTAQKVKYPKLGAIPTTNNDRFNPPINVESDRVIRWRAVSFKGVKISPSPAHVQKRLRSYGIEVINNIVDITNYIMIEAGMPIHAFDLDKLGSITLRTARSGESLVTFEGTKLQFDENDLIAADGNKPLTLTTAVGGRESGITNGTKNILIEAGLYDQPTARRSALRLNVRNETAGRLGKYLHPDYCELAISRAITLIKDLLGINPEPISFDYYPNKYPKVAVSMSQQRLNLIAGEEIGLEEAARILEGLEFNVSSPLKDGELVVGVPYFRTDVVMEDDVIEEVLRIRGYDKIPTYLPLLPAPKKLEFPEMELEEQAKDILARLGFNETISQQIVDKKEIEKAGFWDESRVVKLENSWNEELNAMRYDMASPQFNYLLSYQKHGFSEVKIFEIGKTYSKNSQKSGYESYTETRKIVFTATKDFRSFKSDVLSFLRELGIGEIAFEKFSFSLFKDQKSAQMKYNGTTIGKMGEVKSSILADFKVRGTVSHVVFYTLELLKFAKAQSPLELVTTITNFVIEDRTFTVPASFEIGKILGAIKNVVDISTRITFVSVFENENLKEKGKKSVTFNFKFDPARTEEETKKLNGLVFR